jgi:MFS family permease
MTTVAAPVPLTYRQVLANDVIRRVWYAQVVSLFGDFLALFAVISVVSFRMHGTANQVTFVQIAYMLPLVILGPIAGVFVDRWPLKPTLIASDLIRAALAILLIFATDVWHVYVVLAALSCISSFFGPAQTVTIRTHIETEGLVGANALMQLAFLGARILGPAVAGELVVLLGPSSCYALDVLSFFASASLVGSVVIRRPPSTASARESSSDRVRDILVDMTEGSKFIFHHGAIVFVVLAMAAGMFIVGCFGPLISIYVRDTLRASAGAFGFVSGTVGIGMLVGTQLVRRLVQHMKYETLVLAGLAGIGAAVLLLGAVPHIAATVVATFGIGFSFGAIIVPAQTLFQRETPHELLGRVSSTMTSIVFLAQVLGLFASGILAEAIGVRAVFFLCSVLAATLVGAGRMLVAASQ